jgi:hypothetical protein
MSMHWENHMDLEGVLIMVRAHVEDGLDQGGQIIQTRSDELVPKEVGTLAATVRVKESRGGINTVAITYDGPYARYQHDNIQFKHPTGGVAKYLELAMIEKGGDAINKAGEHIWDHVTARAWGSL